MKMKNKIQSLLNENLDDSMFLKKLNELVKEHEYLNTDIQEEETDFHKLFEDTLKSLSDSSQQPNLIPTHFKEIDNLIGGLIPGEFVVLGGRPSMGKTQFLVNLALNLSLQKPALFFTYDLTKESLVKRFISCITHIPISYLMHKNLTTDMHQRIEQARLQITQHKLFISSHNSMDGFRSICKKHVEEYGVKFIFVDYLQLMTSKKHAKYRELEVSHISRELKLLANDLQVCVIASSQLSRSVETRGGYKRPILSDIRESGAIEQDADKILFMYRPEYYLILENESGKSTKNMVEIIIAKNRNGATGSVEIQKDDYFTHFSDVFAVSADFEFNQSRLEELSADDFPPDDHPF
jgi:replicative DNA helicase